MKAIQSKLLHLMIINQTCLIIYLRRLLLNSLWNKNNNSAKKITVKYKIISKMQKIKTHRTFEKLS